MQRSRFKLPQSDWGTTVSKYHPDDPHVSSDDFTAGSKNFETDLHGVVTKRLGDKNYEPSPTTGVIKDLYEAVFSDGAHHLLRVRSGSLEYTTGNNVFNLVTAGYSALGNFEFATFADRVYFGNGIDAPQVYDRTTSYGGVNYTAPKTKNMGAQAPLTALTAAVGGAGSVPAGSYLYKVTYLYYDFEESNGGPASVAVAPGVPSMINLTAIPTGGYGVTARLIYRSADAGLSYNLVVTIPDNTTTTATDNAALGTASIPLDHDTPRNFSLIVNCQGRLWTAGIPGDPSNLDYSAATQPDIFLTNNTVICDEADMITGLVVYNNRVVVFNRNSFGQILGNSPDTFRYSPVPGNIGCVDNRSIQVRTLHGVPVLIWLSNKGFYVFNGSTVEYVSDEIEDLVNFNIQQGSQTIGSQSQSSFSQFSSGYFVTDGGIDLTSNPGVITTKDPIYTVNTTAGWEAGSLLSAIATKDAGFPNSIEQIEEFVFEPSAGSNAGTIVAGSTISLPIVTDETGEARGAGGGAAAIPSTDATRWVAYKKTFPRAGTLTQMSVQLSGAANTLFWMVSPDNGSGFPSAVHTYISGTTNYGAGVHNIVHTLSVSLPAGTYWMGPAMATGDQNITTTVGKTVSPGVVTGNFHYNGGPFADSAGAPPPVSMTIGFTFAQTPVAASGTWTSAIYDSQYFEDGVSGFSVGLIDTSTFPAGTLARVYVDQSSASDMSSPATQNVDNVSGTTTFSFTPAKRYWQLRVFLTTTDDRVTSSVTSPMLTYPNPATWISATIDNTLGISALNTLTVIVPSLPTGSTVTAYVQKSTLPGSGFADEGSFILALGTNTIALGSVTNPTKRYTRIKFTLNNSGLKLSSAVITSFTLAWTITASFYSSVIDTGATPAGWGVFQTSFALNGGSAAFVMRAATTAVQLTDDVPLGPFVPAFTTVMNGAYPTGVTVDEFAQYGVTFVSTAGHVATVDSVTLNWLITSASSIRAASVFFNRGYYISLAQYGSVVNNVTLQFDSKGRWRIWDGQAIGTFSLFFSKPYYGDAAVAQVRTFLDGTTDHGANINLDVRTKAFDFEDLTKHKALRQMFGTYTATGAIWTVDYSIDGGVTFLPMKDANGNTTFTLPVDNSHFIARMVPESGNELQGKFIMLRFRETSAQTAQLHDCQIDAYIRKGEYIYG